MIREILWKLAAGIVGTTAFIASTDPDRVEEYICSWSRKVLPETTCPELLQDPNWRCIAAIFAIAVLVYALETPLVRALSLLMTVLRGLSRLRQRFSLAFMSTIRRTIVIATEELQGAPVYVDEERAVKIVRQSEFGRAAWMRGQEPKSLFDQLSGTLGNLKSDPQTEANEREYDFWIKHVLETFRDESELTVKSENSAPATKVTEAGEFRYSESALHVWLKNRMLSRVSERFGEI